MGTLQPAAPVPIDTIAIEERATLVSLLEGLAESDWDRTTECPAWTVRGICLHLLGDDLSLLARQRDDRRSPVSIQAEAQGWDQLFVLLDTFNEAWVDAATFISPRLLCELLTLTGAWTHEWYTTVDPDRLGEPVPWVNLDPSPYWFLGAREYFERWIHHQQIRRALGAPPLDDPRWVVPSVGILARGFPAGMALLDAAAGTTLSVVLPDAAWTVEKGPTGWQLVDGRPDEPTATVAMGYDHAALVFSRALAPADIASGIELDGERELASLFVAGLGAFFGR